MTFYQLKTTQTGIELLPDYKSACRSNQVADQSESAGVIARGANEKCAEKRNYY